MAEARSRDHPSWATLPIDVLSIVLIRLPVKFLVRLKSVCKSWYFLITSREFANNHLRRNSLSYDRLLIFAGKDDSLYSVNLATPESRAAKIPFPSVAERLSRKNIVGSCNGLLLCICDETPNFEALLLSSSSVPCKRIPKLEVPRDCLYVNYGLGYDFKTDDYKIVRIVHFLLSSTICREAMVYSLRADSWKLSKKKIPVCGTPNSEGGALVNNNLLHWLSSYQRQYRIVSFDVCNEEWNEVPMLDHTERTDILDMGVLNGCLCLLISADGVSLVGLNVWVMKEYGVKESWVKLFDLSDWCQIGSLLMNPIAYSHEGSEILLRRDRLSRAFWYNFSEKTVKGAESLGVPGYRHVTTCFRSLIPPFDNDRIGDEKTWPRSLEGSLY